MPDFTSLIGSVAGVLTTVAFVPQLVQVVKTKSTHDISLFMFIIFSTGVLLWMIYGLLLKSPPLIFANLIVFILAFIILIYKIKYK